MERYWKLMTYNNNHLLYMKQYKLWAWLYLQVLSLNQSKQRSLLVHDICLWRWIYKRGKIKILGTAGQKLFLSLTWQTFGVLTLLSNVFQFNRRICHILRFTCRWNKHIFELQGFISNTCNQSLKSSCCCICKCSMLIKRCKLYRFQHLQPQD